MLKYKTKNNFTNLIFSGFDFYLGWFAAGLGDRKNLVGTNRMFLIFRSLDEFFGKVGVFGHNIDSKLERKLPLGVELRTQSGILPKLDCKLVNSFSFISTRFF